MLRTALLVSLLLVPAGVSAQYSDLGDPATWDKRTRLKGLARFLMSLTDSEYERKYHEFPEAAESPRLASRAEAVESVYATLAGLEYQDAALAAPVESGRAYYDDYERVIGEDAQRVAVDPNSMEETGLGKTLLKMLGKAAINYVRFGVPIPVGRGLGSEAETLTSHLTETLAGLEGELAAAEPGSAEAAELHAQIGRIYEELGASTTAPDSDAARKAKKKARIRELAELLETFSESEYREALGQTSAKSSANPSLASKGTLLNTAYTTLAAMEYSEAAAQAPKEASAQYRDAYIRVSRDKEIGVNPETLEEAGWFGNLLTIGALGGLGYLAYDQYGKHTHHRDDSAPPSAAGPDPEEERREREARDKEREEKERLDREAWEKEQADKSDREKEAWRKEQERLERERLDRERKERERLDRERAEKEARLKEQERKQREELDRQKEAERRRLEEWRIRQENFKQEQERLRREREERARKDEKERLERERAEKERFEREAARLKAERERLQKELERARLEKKLQEEKRLRQEYEEKKRREAKCAAAQAKTCPRGQIKLVNQEKCEASCGEGPWMPPVCHSRLTAAAAMISRPGAAVGAPPPSAPMRCSVGAGLRWNRGKCSWDCVSYTTPVTGLPGASKPPARYAPLPYRQNPIAVIRVPTVPSRRKGPAQRRRYTPFVRAGRAVELYESLGGLEEGLAQSDGGTAVSAGFHYKMGAVYEDLASAALNAPAAPPAPPAPAVSPKAEARPAAPAPQERKVETRAQKKAKKRVRKQRKKPAKSRPSRREQDERDMKDLEEMGADMSREINQRRVEREERRKNR